MTESRAELDLLREAIEEISVGLAVITTEGIFRQVNRAFCEFLGYSRAELIGQSFRRITHPEDIARDEEHLAMIRAGAEPPSVVDKRYLRKDGQEVWVRRSNAVLKDSSGQARYVVGALVALAGERMRGRAPRELERHQHLTQAILDAIPNPVYFKDRDGRYPIYNRAWDELFAASAGGAGKARFEARTGPEHEERDRALLERPSAATYEARVVDAAGVERQMLFNKVSFVDEKGEVAGLLGGITDVTDCKEAERALEASEARFRVLTESSMDLISVLGEDGTISYQSPSLRSLLGFDPSEAVGRNLFEMLHPDDVESVRSAFQRIIEARQSGEPVEFRMCHRDGLWRTFESLGTKGLAHPHIRGVVFNSRDVTDRKVIQQRIQHLAYHDNLTGLPNRSLLQDRLAHSIARAERSGRKVGVLFIDLDNFKNINDTLGHDVGDELLRQVSRRLTECVRLEDTIARQGGDEFIVLLDSLDDGRGASVVAQKILNTLRQ